MAGGAIPVPPEDETLVVGVVVVVVVYVAVAGELVLGAFLDGGMTFVVVVFMVVMVVVVTLTTTVSLRMLPTMAAKKEPRTASMSQTERLRGMADEKGGMTTAMKVMSRRRRRGSDKSIMLNNTCRRKLRRCREWFLFDDAQIRSPSKCAMMTCWALAMGTTREINAGRRWAIKYLKGINITKLERLGLSGAVFF